MNINATLFAQLIVFFILVWFTMRFVWPPIAKALDERADKIAEGLAAAERGKNDFEQAEKKVAELLAEGRHQVTEMVANAEKRALLPKRRCFCVRRQYRGFSGYKGRGRRPTTNCCWHPH